MIIVLTLFISKPFYAQVFSVPLGLKTVIVFEMSVSESEMLGTDS